MADKAIRIQLTDVSSSTFSAAGYDASRQILALKFKTGRIRHYAGVPLDVALGFSSAISKGKYFNSEIRGKYQAEPMTGDCPKCGDHGWIGETCADCGCSAYAAPARPVLHCVMWDEPTATSRRSRRAACGAWVRPVDEARLEASVSCDKCKGRLAALEGMVF